MTFEQYIPLAKRTETDYHQATGWFLNKAHARLSHVIVGLSTESNETLYFTDQVNLFEELGDHLWYLALAADDGMRIELRSEIYFEGRPDVRSLVEHLHQKTSNLLDLWKKIVFYGKPVEGGQLSLMLSEVFTIIHWIAHQQGTNVGRLMERNIAKLKARYGDKFSEEKAEIRDLDKERGVLSSPSVI